MVYVKYCIHEKHNNPLDSITTNWTVKHISVKGQIVVKTCQNGNPDIHQIPRQWSRSRRTNGKMAITKLIATTGSSREIGLKRREEGKTMSSQMQTATQGNQQTNRSTNEGGGRDKLKNVDGDSQRKALEDNTKKRMLERKRRRTTQIQQCWRRHATVSEKNWKEKAKAAAAAMKVKKTIKAKWWAEAQICAAIRQERETMKKLQTTTIHSSGLWRIWDQCTKWTNWRIGLRARRLPMGCNISVWNMEAWQSRKMGDTSQTHIHGCRKIRQQTRRWYLIEQEVEAKNYWHWIHQRTGHHRHDRGKPPTHQTVECILHPLGICGPITSKKCTKRSRSTRQITKDTYLLLEDTSMQNWDLVTEKNAKVLADTRSTREIKEVIGWNMGWCYKDTQHSTRCTEKHLRNTRPSYLQKVLTTFWPSEDVWDTLKTPRPTTWSTWEVTTDVSWQHSRSPCLERTSNTRIQWKTRHDWTWGTRPSRNTHWSRGAWARPPQKMP